jgi:hypothetical protein
LTHGNAVTSRLIRFGQGLRIHGKDRIYTQWNDAALVISASEDSVEALGRGVSRTNASAFKGSEYHVVDTGDTDEDRREVVAFGAWSASQNEKYGFVTVASSPGLSSLEARSAST